MLGARLLLFTLRSIAYCFKQKIIVLQTTVPLLLVSAIGVISFGRLYRFFTPEINR